MRGAAIAAVLVAAIAGAYAATGDRSAQLESARSARAIIADKLEPRRAQSRARLLALYRASSITRSVFEPDGRWQRARARADLIRVVRRDLGELAALERELSWVSEAAVELDDAGANPERPALLRPVDGARVVSGFGPHRAALRVTSVRQGVELEVVAGATVRAPASGSVVFTGPVRHLGEAAVIEVDGHWITLGPLTLERPLGASVERGERIGRTAGQRLHVQLRAVDSRGGKPMDPRPFADPPGAP